MQRAEVYLPEVGGKKKKKETVAPSPTPTAKGKKSVQRIKALSPKVRKDEQLEVRIYRSKGCITRRNIPQILCRLYSRTNFLRDYF